MRALETVEMKQEQQRLEAEILDFSCMLDEFTEARDDAIRESQHWQSEARARPLMKTTTLRQQMRL